MTDSPPRAPGDGAVVVRHPCEWCGEPDRWPDRCSETREAADPRCAATIESRCARGDHRRCAPSACAVAARWHEPVRRAGVRVARATGTTWAVVSTIEDHDVSVIATENDLGRAGSLVRDAFLRRAGIPLGSERAGRLYVVRGSDGELF